MEVIQTPLINTWEEKKIPGVTPRSQKPSKKDKGKKKDVEVPAEPSEPEIVVFE